MNRASRVRLFEVELAQSDRGFHCLSLEPAHNYSVMPFDLYGPSVTGLIQKRLCVCNSVGNIS